MASLDRGVDTRAYQPVPQRLLAALTPALGVFRELQFLDLSPTSSVDLGTMNSSESEELHLSSSWAEACPKLIRYGGPNASKIGFNSDARRFSSAAPFISIISNPEKDDPLSLVTSHLFILLSVILAFRILITFYVSPNLFYHKDPLVRMGFRSFLLLRKYFHFRSPFPHFLAFLR